MKILTWGLVIVLAAFMVFMGMQKFGEANPIFQYLASSTGMPIFEPGVRMLTGIAEITAAVLLVWPRTRIFGALLAAAVLGGALGFHLSPFLGINAPVAFDADGGYVKSPMLFYMAASFFLITMILIYLERLKPKTTED